MADNNNHPNRNWRSRMHQACANWIATLNMPGVAVLQTREELQESLTMAYLAGYEAGRESRKPKPK